MLRQKGAVEMPSGDMMIHEGDRVVVFAERSVVRQVEQLFRVSVEFF